MFYRSAGRVVSVEHLQTLAKIRGAKISTDSVRVLKELQRYNSGRFYLTGSLSTRGNKIPYDADFFCVHQPGIEDFLHKLGFFSAGEGYSDPSVHTVYRYFGPQVRGRNVINQIDIQVIRHDFINRKNEAQTLYEKLGPFLRPLSKSASASLWYLLMETEAP